MVLVVMVFCDDWDEDGNEVGDGEDGNGDGAGDIC